MDSPLTFPDGRAPRVGLAYDLRQDYLDLGFTPEETCEFDRPDTIDGIEDALRALGACTDRIGNVWRLAERLAAGDRWDLVFNIAEGMEGFGRESQVPALLEAYGVPVVFSDSAVLALTLHKGHCKQVIRHLGLATPAFAVYDGEADLARIDLPYPLFAKPVAEGTGKGISAASRIDDPQALARVCADLRRRFDQPVLVETYLPGREFTVGLTGTGPDAAVVGTLEILLGEAAEAAGYGYVNKSEYEGRVTYRIVAPSDPAVAKTEALALQAWRALGCRDGGRMDLRCDAAGEPHFIEVNPLAGLNPTHSDLAILCRLQGIPYPELIRRIVASALRRVDGPEPWRRRPAGRVLAAASAARPLAPHVTVDPTSRRVVIIHEALDRAHAAIDDAEGLDDAEEIAEGLQETGYQVTFLPVSLDLRAFAADIRRLRPAFVFNAIDALGGRGAANHLPLEVLDALGVPYTGGSAAVVRLTTDKLATKRVLAAAGVATPPWVERDAIAADRIPFDGPYILKPVAEDASVGIDADGVVARRADLRAAWERREAALGLPCFAEAFIDGREFNVAALAGPDGPEVMPPAEMQFFDYGPDRPRIVGYNAKWVEGTFEHESSERRLDLPPEDAPLVQRLRATVLRCWRLLGLRGYARVDMRVSADGTPYVLEVNSSPALASHAGFRVAAAHRGLDFPAVLRRILADLHHPRDVRTPPLPLARTPLPAAPEDPELRFRPTPRPDDREAIRRILAEPPGYFLPAEIEVAVELLDDALENPETSSYRFLFAERHGRVEGYACYGPTPCTVSSWDLYWIGVDPALRQGGLGRRLMRRCEDLIAAAGGTRVYVETASRAEYDPTRVFYERIGYEQQAHVPDFYRPGDGKLIFVRAL